MINAKLLGGLLSWLMLASATAVTPPKLDLPVAGVKPALWSVSDPDTTIYLFGTIHMLPKDFDWQTPAFEKAAAEADELYLEVVDMEDEQASARRFIRMSVSPGLPPVTERVPANRRARLKLMIDLAGTNVATISQFESWAVALSLAQSSIRDLNVSADYGVERILGDKFRALKKPVLGLETSEQQLGYFDGLPEAAQRVFLVSLIDEQTDVRKSFEDMIAAWSSGDEQKIALSFDDELALSPELTETLLRKRNRNWADWLVKRLDQPGIVMVAVGAGHLAGTDSVQSLLKARGLTVTRVQ
jgi:uncharacterized protein